MGTRRGDLRTELAEVTAQLADLSIRVSALEERLEEEEWIGIDTTPSTGAASRGEIDPQDRPARERLCRDIGLFLRRAVRGERLGSSGRDRLRLQNRCYLIVKDYEGRVVEPPIFTESFAAVKQRCKRGSELGRAAFVGLPSRWEARLVCLEGGFQLPAELNDGN